MKAVPSPGYLYLFSDQLDVSPMILFLEEPRCHIPKVLGAWSICLSLFALCTWVGCFPSPETPW